MAATTTPPEEREPPAGSTPTYLLTDEDRTLAYEHAHEGEEQFPIDEPGRGWESLIVFVVLGALFTYIGYRTIVDQHVVVFDALDRLTRAYLVWHNSPAKLAAIGFVFPPLTTMVFLPFAAIKPLATSLIALPLTTAIFASGTCVVLYRLFARCGMPVFLRVPLVLVFAANPLFLFYAGNGMSEAVYLFFLACSLYGFVSWYSMLEPRFLVGAGISLAIAVLVRYGFLWWGLVMAILIAAALVRRDRGRDEVEGSVITYLAPIVYAVTLWTVFNALIVGDPFNWFTTSATNFAVNSSGVSSKGSVSVADVSDRLIKLLVGVSPLTLVILPILLVAFVLARNDMSLWLASFLALGIVVIGVDALIQQDEGLLRLRDAMPVMLTAVVAAAWLYRSFDGLGIAVWLATVVILALTWPLTFSAMKNYRFQNEEQAYARALQTGKDQEGTNSKGGFKVGIKSERAMAQYLKNTVHHHNAVLTDNAQTFGVILLNGRPGDFFDRADKGDAKWKETLANPFGRVQYLLIARQAPGDLIRSAYPNAANGTDPTFTRAFLTDRYMLVKVPAHRTATPRRRRAVPIGQVPAGVSTQNPQTTIAPSGAAGAAGGG